jgi:hypothetical protein
MSPLTKFLLAVAAYAVILAIAAYTAHVSGAQGRTIGLWLLVFVFLGPLALVVYAVVHSRKNRAAPWQRGLALPAADTHHSRFAGV